MLKYSDFKVHMGVCMCLTVVFIYRKYDMNLVLLIAEKIDAYSAAPQTCLAPHSQTENGHQGLV